MSSATLNQVVDKASAFLRQRDGARRAHAEASQIIHELHGGDPDRSWRECGHTACEGSRERERVSEDV